MKKSVRLGLGISIVALTVVVFVYYLSKHRNLLHQLLQTSPLTIVILLALYGFWFSTLAITIQASLRLCRYAPLATQENLLLNAYSTLVNFFVPGQGGAAVRGLYLKKRHNLKIRTYIFVTLLFYGMYAVVSALLLLVRSRPWWQTVIAILFIVGLSAAVVALYKRRNHVSEAVLDLHPSKLLYLLAATVLQSVAQLAIYTVELHSVNSHITIGQAMTYTGAANFALFVALTPGAIGIRESFLLFSRRLHHISSANIVAASVIDRSVFIVFLAILFVVTIGFHAKDRLHIKAASEIADEPK